MSLSPLCVATIVTDRRSLPGGTFFRAQDASQLSSALAKLPAAFSVVRKRVDIAAGFAPLARIATVPSPFACWQTASNCGNVS